MTTSSGRDRTGDVSGFCRWFDPNRGYGFVTSDLTKSKEEDVFLHGRHLKGGQHLQKWPVGTPVTYKKRLSEKTGKPEAYDANMESDNGRT